MKHLLRKSYALLSVFFVVSSVHSFNQPPSNLGATSFLDGAAPPPGVYYINYSVFSNGKKAVNIDGDTIAGGAKVAALTNLHQFTFISNWEVLGGNFVYQALVPVVAVTTKGSLTGSLGPVAMSNATAGLGDLVTGPAIQWYNKKLFHRPFFSRLEADVVLPTGSYDENYLANPGSNLVTVEPFYALTWFFSEKWETSWRVIYHMNGENKDFNGGPLGKGLEPGDTLSFNYTLSRAVSPKWRLGIAGYGLKQLTLDKIGGDEQAGSKEQVFGVGPGFALVNMENGGYAVMFNHILETNVKNRFSGSKTNLQITLKFH